MHLPMNMALAPTLAMEAMATEAMAAMVATMMIVRSSKLVLDFLAVVDLMVVSRAMDYHAMDLDSQ